MYFLKHRFGSVHLVFIFTSWFSVVTSEILPSVDAITTCSPSNPTACFIRRAIECKLCYYGNKSYACALFANEIYRRDLSQFAFGEPIDSNIAESKFYSLFQSQPDRLNTFCIGFKEVFLSQKTTGLDIGENYTIASEGVSVSLADEIEKLTNIAVTITTAVLFDSNLPSFFPSTRIPVKLSTVNRRLVGPQRLPTYSEHTIRSTKEIREGAIVKVVRGLPNQKGWKQYYIKNTNAFRVVRISNKLYILYVPFKRNFL